MNNFPVIMIFQFLKIVEASGGDRHDHFLKWVDVTSIHNILFALNNPTEGAININILNDELIINSPFEGDYLRMADQKQGQLIENSNQTLQLRSLYNVAGLQFVFPDDGCQNQGPQSIISQKDD